MIDQSLRDKISENEEKVKKLFKFKTGLKRKKSNKINNEVKKGNIYTKVKINKISKNASLKKIDSFKENKENQKNYINLELTPIIKSSLNSNNSTITSSKLDSFIKPKAKYPVVKSYYNKKSLEKENKYKPKNKIKYKELDSFINIKKSNNINNSKDKIKTLDDKNISNKIKRIKNRANSISNIIDSEAYISNPKIRKSSLIKKNSFYFNNLDTLSTSTSRIPMPHKMSSNSNKSFDFNLTYERFIENESKKNERISKIKKKREKFESKIYPHQPRINQKSKSITKSITDGFLTRLEKYQKQQIEREELLRKSILKDEFEKINKSNFLMIKKKLKKKNTNVSMDKTYNNKTISESINKLLDWEKKRKEKIENEIKKQDLIEKNGHIPKINKSKNNIPNEKDITKRVCDRLYYSNKRIIGFKMEIKEESTPKFTSKLSKTKSQPNIFYNLKKIISYPNEMESENKDKNNFKNENKKEKPNININIEENINNIKIEKFDDIDDDDIIIKKNDNISINDNMNDKINNKLNGDEKKEPKNSDKKEYENELKGKNEESHQQKNIIVVIRKNKSKVDVKSCS